MSIYDAISFELGYDRKKYLRNYKKKNAKPKKRPAVNNRRNTRFNGKNQMIRDNG